MRLEPTSFRTRARRLPQDAGVSRLSRNAFREPTCDTLATCVELPVSESYCTVQLGFCSAITPLEISKTRCWKPTVNNTFSGSVALGISEERSKLVMIRLYLTADLSSLSLMCSDFSMQTRCSFVFSFFFLRPDADLASKQRTLMRFAELAKLYTQIHGLTFAATS